MSSHPIAGSLPAQPWPMTMSPSAPETPEMPGTPTSTTTTLSALSTAAVKDGHRGSHQLPTRNPQWPTSLESERADRISRLPGFERVTLTSHPNPAQQQDTPPSIYFDSRGQPVAVKKMSSVGTPSATTGPDNDSQMTNFDDDMSTDTSFRGSDCLSPGNHSSFYADDGMSVRSASEVNDDDEVASLVGFGEGASSTVSGPIYRRTNSIPLSSAAALAAASTMVAMSNLTPPNTSTNATNATNTATTATTTSTVTPPAAPVFLERSNSAFSDTSSLSHARRERQSVYTGHHEDSRIGSSTELPFAASASNLTSFSVHATGSTSAGAGASHGVHGNGINGNAFSSAAANGNTSLVTSTITFPSYQTTSAPVSPTPLTPRAIFPGDVADPGNIAPSVTSLEEDIIQQGGQSPVPGSAHLHHASLSSMGHGYGPSSMNHTTHSSIHSSTPMSTPVSASASTPNTSSPSTTAASSAMTRSSHMIQLRAALLARARAGQRTMG